jgi:glycosyltransferase involved in cell wall biosynthesis
VIKIAYDHQFFSMFGYSGITRYHFEVIARLVEDPSVEVSLFMGWHKNKFDYARFKKKYAHFFGFRRPGIPRTTGIFNTLNDALFPLFLARSRSRLYHQTYYRYYVPSYRGKRVLTVHDMTYELFPGKFSPADPVILDKRTSIDRADAIIAVSMSTKNDLVRLCGIPPERVTVIYHGNSLTVTPGGKPPANGPYILYVGQRVPHKNFPALLNAYCRSSRVNKEFGLVCFGGEPFTDAEKQVLAKNGLLGRARQVSGSDEDLAGYYSRASLLVYPSLYEGFGLPLLEAMHYGCPVVASNVSSLPEVGADAGLYFDPADTADLMDKMERVLFGDSLRRGMVERGHVREKQFSWDRAAAETLEVYKRLVS